MFTLVLQTMAAPVESLRFKDMTALIELSIRDYGLAPGKALTLA